LTDALAEYRQFDMQGSGFGVMRALIRTSSAPRIIVLTNHDLPEYLTAALNLGAAAFLDKARHFHSLPEILSEKLRAPDLC
jgi:DNA-binding NarL/FixJ family response regulator